MLLGLSDTLAQLGKDLSEAEGKLQKAKDAEDLLTKKLLNLENNLDLGTIADPTDLDQVKEHADTAIFRLDAINSQFDGLIEALTKADPGGSNTLTNYIRIERLLSVLGAEDFWLQLKVINAGGNNRIKTNLLVDIFRGGNRVSHSGGVIVQYHLFASDGRSVASGTASSYEGYVNASKIPR
jgi:hypothetical protein